MGFGPHFAAEKGIQNSFQGLETHKGHFGNFE